MNVERKGRLDYSRFDELDTAMLEALLRADFDAPEAEQMDEEAVLYILNILDERQKANPQTPQPDVEAAQARFFQDYMPLLEHKELLLDFYNVSDEDKREPAKKEFAAWDMFRRLPRSVRRWVSVAMVLVLLLSGSATAYAFGYNPFAALASWTEDVLWFNKTPVTAELRDELLKHFKAEYVDGMVPKWLPAGYKFYNLVGEEDSSNIEVRAEYHKNVSENTDALYLYYIQKMNDYTTLYEKDNAETVIYTANNNDYYVVFNNGYRIVAWLQNEIECYIVGDFSLEDAKKMIDSICQE